MTIGITKNNQILMSSLFKSFGGSNLYVLMITFLSVSTLTFLIAHILLVKNEIKVMHDYSYEILERTDKAAQQIQDVLLLADAKNHSSCAKEDLGGLRSILSHYYLIEDAGIIENYKVACTAKIGVLEEPKFINPALFVQSAIEKIDVLLSKDELFYAGEKRTIFKYKNIFITIAPNLYIGIDFPNEYTGAVIMSSVRKIVFREHYNLKLKRVNMNTEQIGFLSQYVPFPNRIVSVKNCSIRYTYCVNAVDYKIGVYGLHNDILMLLISLSILLSYTIFISFSYFKSTKETMKYRLMLAIKKDGFYPLYQPKINLETGSVIGVEALARWEDDKLGFVPPDEFIELAEDMKIIQKVTKSITKLVLDESKELLHNNKAFTVSINLSVQDLAGPDFLNFLEDEVDRHGICRQQIILEITERSATESDDLSNSVHDFYEKGYQISLDDFGTGFCNLSWLSKLESNEIKIDRMFTHSISTKSIGLVTLDSICILLKNFDMKTVFEGIETQEEADYILSKSPNAIGQGWLFAKAMTMVELKEFINRKAQ
ncbi:EAL domain-containing protein [Marinomonas sp.]